MNINSEENMKKLLQAVCKPVAASSEFKERLLKHLTHKVSGEAKEATIPLWKQPKLWVPIAAVIILAAIGYGMWLPLAATPTVTPPATTPVSPPVAPPAPPPVTPPSPTLPPTPTALSTGMLEIQVTDAPPEHGVSAIYVTIANIEVHRSGEDGGWITVLEGNEDFELLELIGVVESLCQQEMDVGHYTQIRMDIENVEAIVDSEVESAEVKLPSGKLRAVVSFDINEDKTTAITLDFDAAKSLVFTGEGKVIFKPVVKLIVTYEDENAEQ